MGKPFLTEVERLAVDALKSSAPQLFLNSPHRNQGKSFLAAVAISEMAEELGGIWIRDGRSGKDYFVPPGTPWQEALPARESP